MKRLQEDDIITIRVMSNDKPISSPEDWQTVLIEHWRGEHVIGYPSPGEVIGMLKTTRQWSKNKAGK